MTKLNMLLYDVAITWFLQSLAQGSEKQTPNEIRFYHKYQNSQLQIFCNKKGAQNLNVSDITFHQLYFRDKGEESFDEYKMVSQFV